jgi:catechol 2,3-dioxygenase-like lactoylglutathione lyase family enzyme
MTLPVEGVNELVLEVADLEAAERFYVDLLGFPVIDRWPAPREAVWVLAGRTRIGLWLPQTGIARGRGGSRVHYALSVTAANYAPVVRRLRERGLPVDEVEWSEGAAYSAYVADPDYNVVEFWTWDVSQGSAGPATAATENVYALPDLPVLKHER